jgi:hypothetical protein
MSDLVKKILEEAFLIEGKQVGMLYHFTSFRRAFMLLEQDRMRVNYAEWPGAQKNCLYGFSTTRDKNFHISGDRNAGGITGTSVRLNLDGNKLSQKYKIRPFDLNSSNIGRQSMNCESEEFVITGRYGIEGIIKYIISISIFPEQERGDSIKNAKDLIFLIKSQGIDLDIDKIWLDYINEFD